MTPVCPVCGYTVAERIKHGCAPGGCTVAQGTSQDPARCMMNAIVSEPRFKPKLMPSRWTVLETVDTVREVE